MNYITYKFETSKLTLKFFVPFRAQFLFNTTLIVIYQGFKVRLSRNIL
jgi:hypothetical protein